MTVNGAPHQWTSAMASVTTTHASSTLVDVSGGERAPTIERHWDE